jgi:hypothetical protein
MSFLFFFTTSVVLAKGLRQVSGPVTRHPLREKESPLPSAIQGDRTGREGRKKSEQFQQSIQPIRLEGLAKG